MQRLITRQNAPQKNFHYNLWFWKKKLIEQKFKKHFKSVSPVWKVISSIAKITTTLVKHLQIWHSSVAYLFLKFAGKELCVLHILLAK